MGLFPHVVLPLPRMGNVIQHNLYQYFDHIPGLPDLLEHIHGYVEDWVRVFYATLYVGPEREYIQFMFQGLPVRLYRQNVAILLGLELSERRLHTDVYGDSEPPRRSKNEWIALTDNEVHDLFREGAQERIPSQLTPSAGIVHRAMRRTLLPRLGYKEGITTLQQHLPRALMQRIRFCVVDLLIAEMEDVIIDGMGAHRSFPYAHYISHMLSRIDHDPDATPLP